ncbi:MAG: hypothetical protein FJY82_03820 [Candidatus Aminicenantes bacterium]|nr:hypothetical protein [Candidatus Aminicenantes bacterium]
MSKRIPSTLIVMGIFALFAAAASQTKPLKVLLLYDMEGVTGATSVKHTSFSSKTEYEAGRISLTADVNAAIAGLKAGGATEIIVVDGHGSGNTTGPDVIVDQLLAPAKMISRERPFDIYMDSYDQSIDAIVAVGMHAGAGNEAGFISHTYTIEDTQYRVNGIPFNESMILAMGAARYGLPLIMVCGDDELEKEMRRFLPWAKYAVVKRAVGRAKAEPYPREEVSRRIENAAREAILALAAMRTAAITSAPFRFALTFQDDQQAQAVARLQGAEMAPDGVAVQIKSHDFEEGYRASLRMISTAGLVGRVQSLQRAIDAQPNAEALRQAARDLVIDRWFNPPPGGAVPSGAAAPLRYWGAR